MKKHHIAEDLPARKFPQASLSVKKDETGGDNQKNSSRETSGEKTVEERVSQAASDIRYKAEKEKIPLLSAFNAYMQTSKLSQQEKEMVRKKVLSGRSGNVSEAVMSDIDISNFAASSVANAMYKVFVENTKEEVIDENQLKDELEEAAHFNKYNTGNERKYKVRVTDKNSKTSYVRYATRQKINDLRANPNIESVEMTEYGEPREGERKGGEQTAAALGGGKAKKDYDDDGKIESPAKEYRGAVHNAIQRKKGLPADGKDTSSVKEEFIGEGKKKPSTRRKKDNGQPLDVMRGSNIVNVNPPEAKDKLYAHYEIEVGGGFLVEKAKSKAQQRFMGMVLATKRGAKAMSPEVEQSAAGMTEKEARKFAKTKHKGLPKHKKSMKEAAECGCDEKPKYDNGKECEDDDRAKYAERQVIKNRIRLATGIKNPIIMTAGYEPEGDIVDESRLGDRARKIENEEAKKGGLTRKRTKREIIAHDLAQSQNVSRHGDLERQKAVGDTGLHKGATRPGDDDHDDDPDMPPTRRRRRPSEDDHPSLSAQERNRNLR